VTDRAKLERSYRRLLAWYPKSFQRENGEELLAVLLESARDGQERPGLAASLDLIGSGLWMRLRPSVPRSTRTVRAAVRLMYAGAAFTVLSLFFSLAAVDFVGRRTGQLRLLGHRQPLPVILATGIVSGLVLIALWLWMARANGEGRRKARVLSTALVILATLHLFGNKGVASEVFAGVTWLVGLAAVWLLWRPSSTAFFKQSGNAAIEADALSSPQTP
jgi:hypothetical protein